MLWCAACCEPYHIYCLQPEDLPLSWKNDFSDKSLQDWICRRCSFCQICGLPGDIECASIDEEGIDQNIFLREKNDNTGKQKLQKSDKYSDTKDEISSRRKRLRCVQCEAVFHSDCLQPSQQNLIKAQGAQWVRSIWHCPLTILLGKSVNITWL